MLDEAFFRDPELEKQILLASQIPERVRESIIRCALQGKSLRMCRALILDAVLRAGSNAESLVYQTSKAYLDLLELSILRGRIP